MDKDGCDFSEVWKFCSYISLDGVVLSVYYLYYLQVGLCAVVYYFSYGVDWSLGQIEDS